MVANRINPKTKKTISILGSTGSIGQATLDIIRANPDTFKVKALTAGADVEKLYNQAIEFKPEIIAVSDKDKYPWLKDKLSDLDIKVEAGVKGLITVTNLSVDFVMASIVGAAGLLPTINALKSCNTLGIANKECLVSAGDLPRPLKIGGCSRFRINDITGYIERMEVVK